MYESGYDGGGALFGGLFWLFAAALYLYFSFAMYKIAKKCNYHSDAWWGFVPILNTLMIIKCAGRPMYWFVFFLIPIVNIVVSVILWMDVAKNVGKDAIWGVLTIVPFVNFVSLGVLAFSDSPTASSSPPPKEPTPREPAGVS